jgi:GNAT superfamily N-acetyltransferase
VKTGLSGLLRICYAVFDAVPGGKFRYWYVLGREVGADEDSGNVAHLKEISRDEAGCLCGVNPELSGAEIAHRYNSGNRCLVWLQDGEVAFYAWVYVNEGAELVLASAVARTSVPLALKPGEAYWWDAYVAPPYRRRGIFSQAVREFVPYLARRGVRRVYSIVDYSNVPSIRGHVAAGFEIASGVVHIRAFGAEKFLKRRVCLRSPRLLARR